MPFLDRGEVSIAYDVLGSGGPWLTLLNGHTRSRSDFRAMAKVMSTSGFRVITIDNRGAGETLCKGEFFLTDLVDDVVFLWNYLGCRKSHVLGISMGGIIAMCIAARYPEIVSKLIVVSSTPDATRISNLREGWPNGMEAIAAKLSRYFDVEFARRNPLLIQAMAKQIDQAIAGGGFENGALRQRKAVEGFRLRDERGLIAASTLIIHGATDRIIPVDSVRDLHAAIEKSRIELMQDTGHLILAEKPKEFYELVVKFLSV